VRFKFSVMVLTQPSRAKFLRRLLDVLDPQVEEFKNDVHVDVRMFDRNLSLGENREIMRQDSMSEYCAFCDDDDILVEDYFSTILPLLDGVDYIGHRINLYRDGVLERPVIHSLRYKGWTSDLNGHYRDIGHVNPMRRELALACPMEGGVSEDFRWAAAMRATGFVKTEHFIDRVLYHYYFRTHKDEAPPAPRETENDVRLDEIERSEKALNWIGSVNDYLKRRRAAIEEKTPNLEFLSQDVRLEEVALLERYDSDLQQIRMYVKRRREEIGAVAK
jgi:hypothetical protein